MGTFPPFSFPGTPPRSPRWFPEASRDCSCSQDWAHRILARASWALTGPGAVSAAPSRPQAPREAPSPPAPHLQGCGPVGAARTGEHSQAAPRGPGTSVGRRPPPLPCALQSRAPRTVFSETSFLVFASPPACGQVKSWGWGRGQVYNPSDNVLRIAPLPHRPGCSGPRTRVVSRGRPRTLSACDSGPLKPAPQTDAVPPAA